MKIDRIQLEHRITNIETRLDELIINHIPHLEKKVNWLIGLLVGSVIVGKVDLKTLIALFQ